ncbi:type III secretion system chaperone [Acanthopleuribacter pedis]|uniref:Type III secretion system chaperone n=1 Tax=Acanthopleuribacter pedis TaxID=442870 RepID=A0A8J7Q9Y1_9BACT|nr:type III secretion system chaperone [Acanthopleuribacter pedis]MBO1321451.1 type III secretion system chaperone [Acanthopleuribacter pedis]
MQEAIDRVNAWLRALDPNLTAGLDEAASITLAFDNQQELSLQLDHDPPQLNWALPISLPGNPNELSDDQLARAAALNYTQQATRGARLAMVDQPEQLHLLYRRPLAKLDEHRFLTLTAGLQQTAQSLTAQLNNDTDATGEPPFQHPSV